MKELPKVYDPKSVEKKVYEMWMDGHYFEGKIDHDKKPFSIVMPPPNVTGQLHMGHALDATLQDILTRYKRMQGYAALWLPGVDHAGIATQIKVEEVLRKEEGKTRYDLGRDKFLERVWDWKQKYGDRIVEQQKSMGVSCDWSRSRFTMDDVCAKAVRETFCDLYEKGLVYKGSRIINWCPHCRTALSDAEVEYKDIPGSFWYIRYPIENSDEEFIIATTRPETMLGDTGVAVNPADEKYQHLVGKNAILPLVGRKLPIVADDYVELGFGTGAVKMTPCHDPNDYEVGLRHNLEQILIFDEATSMLDPKGRREVLAEMKKLRDCGKTVVMITHDVEEAVLADQVILMGRPNGQKDPNTVLAQGSVREILTDSRLLIQVGIVPPMAVRMYEDLKLAGIELNRCPLTKEELAEALCRWKSEN